MVRHNIPLAFSDHLSLFFWECFSDSKIAQKYSSARTKMTATVNKRAAPLFMDELVKQLCSHLFSLATDGSNDTGVSVYHSCWSVECWVSAKVQLMNLSIYVLMITKWN